MKILLASPRGFCAGVKRAVETVTAALEKYGSPIYVRHEIVHNKNVVDDLKKKGAVFVKEVDEAPSGSLVIFSAHGVGKSVYEEAKKRGVHVLDATCPLVSRVHVISKRHEKQNFKIILIGHKGHPEVEGTMGQTESPIHLVETVDDVEKLPFTSEEKLAYVTQTTLSLDETKEVVAAIRERYPSVIGPKGGDLCYATTNRQEAVKSIIDECERLFIIGSKNSSNSNRLMEIGKRKGIPSYLIDSKDELQTAWLEGVSVIGVSSGASAPEYLVSGLVNRIKSLYANVSVEERCVKDENISFFAPIFPEIDKKI